MCDGITQGRAGMELCLFSRDVIAMSAAIALSHDVFDAALLLGVCDKIVPGLVIGALAFGHLPAPGAGGPDGLRPAQRREGRASGSARRGQVGREELLDAEVASYHSPGTCTFYGTANSNQLVMEVMGLHLPGAAFVTPGSPLRAALTAAADPPGGRDRAPATTSTASVDIVDERASSTASSRCSPPAARRTTRCTWWRWPPPPASQLTWEDFDELSSVVPLLARIYPNGPADINQFHAGRRHAVPDRHAARRRAAARGRADRSPAPA